MKKNQYSTIRIQKESKDKLEKFKKDQGMDYSNLIIKMVEFFRLNSISFDDTFDDSLKVFLNKRDQSFRNWLGAVERDYFKKILENTTLLKTLLREKIVIEVDQKNENKSEIIVDNDLEKQIELLNKSLQNSKDEKEIYKGKYDYLMDKIEVKKDRFMGSTILVRMTIEEFENFKNAR